MKAITKATISALVLASALAPVTLANQLTLNRYVGYYSGNGGEFNLSNISGDAQSYVSKYDAKARIGDNSIETFCLEVSEYVSLNHTYEYQINDSAIKGGQAVSDRISVGTGWLYSLFARGLLHGYDYTAGNGRANSAGALQQTIWWLEGEVKTRPDNTFTTQVENYFNGLGGVSPDADSFIYHGETITAAYFGVAVLNLRELNSNDQYWSKQDQTIWTGGGHTFVPDGGVSLMLLGLALGGLSLIRCKMA